MKIRSKGPLLLIVIGLAMLAFILGDAWKIIRPNQGVQYVGTIDGRKISAMDFQSEIEKYTEVVKFTMQGRELSEDQNNAIKDEVWSMMVRDALLEKECRALGITVTDAEVRNVVEQGTDEILANTPFSNAEGKFDADNLKVFIAGYNSLDRSAVPAEEMAYYESMYNYWLFIENSIKTNLLYSKYVALVNSSLISNSVAANNSYVNRIQRADVIMASLPYSSLADDQVSVSTSDMKKVYDKNKEALYNYAENRDIMYIDYEILPSDADRKALLSEVNEITTQLEQQDGDYAAFLRRSGSVVSYSEVARSTENIPEDVVARIDSVNANGVFGPYYNADDDSYNAFRILGKSTGYDSIQFAMIQVVAEDEAETARLSDSIFNAIRKGADFAELAEKYGQDGEAQWLDADSYEPAAFSGDNALYLNKLNSMKKGELANLQVKGANLILKVTDVRTPLTKYDIAVVKRPVEFSTETSNEAYNKLSLFVARNSTLDSLKANADDSDFHLLYYPSFQNYSNNVAGVPKSHEALRWIFGAQEGEVSPSIFEAGNANDHLMVVAVDKIHPKGYRSMEEAYSSLYMEALNNKKFDVQKDKLAGLKSIEELKAVEGIVIDTVQFVNFTNTAYIASSMSNEAIIGASVMNLERNEFTAPMKGLGCTFVAAKISADERSSEFDPEAEKSRLQTIAVRSISNSILEELYYQADIEDNRYKLF